MTHTNAELTTSGLRPLRVVGGAAPAPDPGVGPEIFRPHTTGAFPDRPLVGRGREIAQIIGSIARERLVTLTGPAGIGKTRLALEVAPHIQEMYRDGAWLVELAPVCEADLVAQAVASGLGLDPEPGPDPIDAVVAHLSGAASLLVMDNCEHLLGACATVAERLLADCPRLRILATSQQALGIAGERLIPVAPLSVVDPATVRSAEDALASEAVALFCLRAAAAEPRFRLTEEALPAVVDICARLDGVPLAIELAAALIAALGPADVAEGLDKRFRLLTGGPRTADARHQTLQAALGWSYELLSTEQAALLRRLSVFSGGANLHAIKEVCTDARVPADDAVEVLRALVAKSLVVADTSRPRARYRLLETIRAYGCERLEQEGEAAEVRARHAAWAVSLAEEASQRAGNGYHQFWANALESDHDNIRAALDWAVAESPELALRLASALTPFWKARGYLREGQEWLRRALDASPDAPGALRARALFGLALMAMMRGDLTVARPAAEESLALAREGQLPRAEAQTLSLLGFISMFTQDARTAQPVLEEAVTKARAEGDPESVMRSLALLGQAHLFLGDIESARKAFEESLGLAEVAGADPSGALVGMARTGLASGELGRAEELFRRALPVLREAGERFEIALALSFLGELAWGRGDLAEARRLLEEGRGLAAAMGAPFPLAQCLTGLARVALTEEDLASAEDLAEEACDVATKGRLPYAVVRALHVRGDLRRVKGDAEGARSTYEEALAVARSNDDREGAAASLLRLARLARGAGSNEEAVALLSEGLALQGQGGGGDVMSSLELMAAMAAEQGRPATAAGLFGAAQGLRDAVGSLRRPDEIADYEAAVAGLKSAFEANGLDAAWAQGNKMSREEAVGLALRGRGSRDRPAHGWASLTPTERQVVELVADGLTNKEIAERVFISPRTVQGYLSRVFPKLDVSSRRELREAFRRR